MQIITNAVEYDWATWRMGIMRAFVTGGAGSLAAPTGPMIMDPKDYNLSNGLVRVLASILIAFTFTGLAALGVFLKTHGAPDLNPPEDAPTNSSRP
jgi:hypothetical protein